MESNHLYFQVTFQHVSHVIYNQLKIIQHFKTHYPYHMTHIEPFKDHMILPLSYGTCHMGRYLPSKLGSKHAYSEASVIFSWNSLKYSKSISAIVLEHWWQSDSLSVSNTYGEHDWPHDWPADDAVILVSPIGVIPLNRDHRTVVHSLWSIEIAPDDSCSLKSTAR